MIDPKQGFCPECGSKLIEKPLEGEGIIPFCPVCNDYRFPKFNVAVSMIVINEQTDEILLIQQYGRPFYILVAGYLNRGEQEEQAVVREIKPIRFISTGPGSMNLPIRSCAISPLT